MRKNDKKGSGGKERRVDFLWTWREVAVDWLTGQGLFRIVDPFKLGVGSDVIRSSEQTCTGLLMCTTLIISNLLSTCSLLYNGIELRTLCQTTLCLSWPISCLEYNTMNAWHSQQQGLRLRSCLVTTGK